MEYILVLLISTVLSWILLMIVIPIAQKLADFSMPPWGETMWKLAVVSLAMNGATMLLDPVHFLLGGAAGIIVLWILLAKWLDVDGFGMWIIMGVMFVIRNFVIGFIAILLAKALGVF